VDLGFHSHEIIQSVDWQAKYPKLPTVPASLEELMAVFNKMLEKIEEIPFEQIGQDVQSVVKNMNQTIQISEALLQQVNSEIAPEISVMLKQATHTMAEVEKTFGNESPLNRNAVHALGEMSEAARSLRLLADFLERHPEALIYGKGDSQ
jgi:paraquat-inducible protein B